MGQGGPATNQPATPKGATQAWGHLFQHHLHPGLYWSAVPRLAKPVLIFTKTQTITTVEALSVSYEDGGGGGGGSPLAVLSFNFFLSILC